MIRLACAELAELRSALVDGALSDADRERVLTHLVSCPACRREVADLRELRRRLSAEGTRVATSDGLSSRLVSIGAVPTPRPGRSRRRARRAAVGAVSLLTVAGSVAGVGYAAAPSPAAAAVGDPSASAQADFAAVLTSLPLGTDAVAAALASSGELGVASARHVSPGSVGTGAALAAPVAYRLLERAAQAEHDLSYVGVHGVSVGRSGRAVEGSVRVDARAGQPSLLQVFTRSGQRVRTGSTPGAVAGARTTDSELIALVGQRYRLSGRTGAVAAGRAASVVEAARLGASAQEPVAARWWVDDATGLLLGRQTYDAEGRVSLTAGFESVEIDPRAAPEPAAPRLAEPATTASLTVSSAGALTAEGWYCSESLAGLSLVRLRRGEEAEPDRLHLVYSDGLQTVSVIEQRGVLPVALPGWHRDSGLSVYVRLTEPNLATWQAGETVITVVTSGSPDLLAAAVRALPPEASLRRTTMGRVHAGWARILDPPERPN